MNKSKYKQAGLIACMLLILTSGLLAFPQPAAAQLGVSPTVAATNALTSVKALGPSAASSLASSLNAASLPPSALKFNSLRTALQNFAVNPGVNPDSAVALLGGVMTGNISAALGVELSELPNLGNINSIADLQSALSSVSGIINAAPLAAQQAMLNQVMALTASAAALENILTGGLAGFTSFLSTALPGLAASLGAGLSSYISGLTNGLISALGTPGALIDALVTGTLTSLLTTIATTVATGGATEYSLRCANTSTCCRRCAIEIPQHYLSVRNHVTNEFTSHEQWLLTTFWRDNVLPALMLMAEQLSAAGIHQVQIIGTFLDAKHQLETQTLMQQMSAQAHKDYQPSEGMCTIGTAVRSLVASERRSNLTQLGLAQRMMQRQTLSGDVLSAEGEDSDMRSRREKFITTYCDRADNANGLGTLCPTDVPDVARRNIDVDYTRNIESKLTLNVDFNTPNTGSVSTDEEDVFALSANLFANNIAPAIDKNILATPDGKIRMSAANKLMDLRAILAKRSVAQNSFAALTAMRSNGDDMSAPYTRRLIHELGITNPTEIDNYLGAKPSYFAQMEVLTKKLYQNPTFYTELYDKPANVERKGAALQAIGLMQDRDLFNSLIRSEAVLSVLLETMLVKEQEKVANAAKIGLHGGGR